MKTGMTKRRQPHLAPTETCWHGTGRADEPTRRHTGNLTRREGVLVRQLQTRAIWTPVFAKHVVPRTISNGHVCAVLHMPWGCHQSPLADEADPLPPRVKRAATSGTYEHQKMAAELALAAIERQRPENRLLPTPPQGAGGRRQ
ncbi:hypothetical protein HPB48_010775 [Haemaphysalis longicornis]|uniref:Uncharacterized protein n=1 Tax=Haemaphysalis longicornis TaxID=44386 RepID=A0A9J6H314_HAELO|nr:hypothetical protein HPB48_010775 [Haemaphysalis longicornis]